MPKKTSTPPETTAKRQKRRQPRRVAYLPPDALINFAEFQQLDPIDRTTAWRKRRKGLFPQPVSLPGDGRTLWRLSDALAYVAGRVAKAKRSTAAA